MSSYRCPRCDTPLVIPKGRSGGVCPKCRRAVMLKDLESRPKFGLFCLQITLISLVTAGVIGLVILAMNPNRPRIQLNFSNLFSSAVSGNDAIGTNNYANTRLGYYYYIPQAVIENKDQAPPVLVMVPGQSGNGEAFVPGSAKSFADAENFIIIAPSFIFDEKNWATQQSYQYPSAWSGDALLRIIKEVEKNHQINTGKLYVFGFSAGAQFTLRFCLWRPNDCAAAAGHGSGGLVLPTQHSEVRYFVTVGSQDVTRIKNAKNFYNHAQAVGLYVQYKEYNVGHALTSAQITDSLDFFREAR
jgi:predicted esterase/DNA-directed RNA polymerase subunit RPC12/RpoP